MSRTIFIISDGTGITAEALGKSLLSQFESIHFDYITIPYVNNLKKAKAAVLRINEVVETHDERPIIFTTLVNPKISDYIKQNKGFTIDFFQAYIKPLETELGQKSSHAVGRLHAVKDYVEYMHRINAVNYALTYDDGVKAGHYENADIILIGISRCGKTPTCLYLAMQFGIFAANYPITEEIMHSINLPEPLLKYRSKLFGLTIDAHRLQKIRQIRFPNRDYAKLSRCEMEIKYAEKLFKQQNILYIDTSARSIEEIATEIMAMANLKRRE